MKNILSLLTLLPVVLFGLTFPAQAQDASKSPPKTPLVENHLTAEYDSVKLGQTISLALTQTITEHWHVYWKNPGDSGEATRIKWTLPKGVTAGDIQWPVPSRIPFGPLLNFGYNTKVTYLTDLNIAPDYKQDSIPVHADVELLVCNDICIPETAKLDLTLTIVKDDATPQKTDSALFDDTRAKIPETVAWQGMVEEADQTLMLSFQPDAEILPVLSAAKKVEFYPDEWGLIQNAAEQNVVFENGKIMFKIPRDTRSLTEVKEIKGVIVYDDGHIRKGFNVQTPIAAMPDKKKNLALPVPTDKTPADGPSSGLPVPPDNTNSTSLWQALLFAFFGGLILNLMPCVFPILSIKALSLVKMSDHEQHQAVFSGIAYTLGVLACFTAIAGILIALQHAGAHIGWGFQLQNPIVVLLLSYILFIVGLNLSGMFEFSGRLGNVGQNLTQKKGYSGSFFTGALATIVATPCTAPFMGVALGYALLQPQIIALLIFMTLGLGLAFPYLLLCIVPPLRKALPRPGAWMETFRQFLSFPMFAAAAWLFWVYGQQVDGYYADLLALLGAVFIAMAIWIWNRAPERNPARVFIRFVAFVFFAVAISIASVSMAKMPIGVRVTSTNSEIPVLAGATIPFSSESFHKLLDGKDPIFVEMTASWCITCKVNEKIALTTDQTRALFRDHHVTYVQGDWTNQNPEITDFLKENGRNGVPLYVFYGERDSTTNKRPEPVVLPQLLTNGVVADIVLNQ